LIYGVNILDL